MDGKKGPRVVVASAPFKGTLTSREAGGCMAQGISRAVPGADVVVVPVADGGEGTLEAALFAMKGEMRVATVDDPLGRPVRAEWGMFGGTAVVEMARASGLPLLAELERNPLAACSSGTGMLVAEAISAGAGRIVVGAGGSATVDGGSGALGALGFGFLDSSGLPVGPGGGGLGRLSLVVFPAGGPPSRGARIEVACDVTNPLLGPLGAAAVYGPQKGASVDDVRALEAGLEAFARAAEAACGIDLSSMPMAGAAGGLSGGFAAFLGAVLVPGGELLLDMLGFDRIIESADLVVTGEGRSDFQTAFGKIPARVAGRAKRMGVKCVAVVGSLGQGWEALLDMGVEKVYPAEGISAGADWDLKSRSKPLISRAAEQAASEFL